MKISFLAFRTVKGKLLGITLISAGAALLAAGAVLALYDYREMRQTLVTGTQTYANIVAQNCTAALSFGDANDAAQTLGSLRRIPRSRRLHLRQLREKTRRLFSRTPRFHPRLHDGKFR